MEWKNIITALISSGFTQAQIAKEAGVTQPTIAGLMSGAQRDMRWENGNRLLTFYRRTTNGKRVTSEATHV